MKIAIGIIGIAFSILMFIQAFLGFGLASLAEDSGLRIASSFGVGASVFMFLGGALSFGVPKLAGYSYLLSAVFAFSKSTDFPDLAIWAALAFILGLASLFIGRKERRKLIEAVEADTQNATSDSGRMVQLDERVCPVCAELIKIKAVKCRFCGSDITAEQPVARPTISKPNVDRSKWPEKERLEKEAEERAEHS